MREVININKDWKFIKQDDEKFMQLKQDESNWEKVDVPHTWNAADGATGEGYFAGVCWYRKQFYIESFAKDKRVFIEFNAVNSVAEIYINEHYLGQHRGGYSIFRFDITQYVEFGKDNLLCVKADNRVIEDVYPLMADFTFHGGIYRDVNVVITNQTHICMADHGSSGVYISQTNVDDKSAQLDIKVKLANDAQVDKKVRLFVDIQDAAGKTAVYAAKELDLSAGERKEATVKAVIEDPVLWDGLENPHMYKAVVSLQSFNDSIDVVTIPFGVRYYKVDPKQGFFLNGKKYPLYGVSRHQDRKDVGWALSAQHEKEDMQLIKDMGVTSIRLAHYQHNQNFYNLCDTEGMVVWAEIPFISTMSDTDLEGKNAKQQMVELIRQNYNHPSILFWGIQNEIQIGGDSPDIRRVVAELNELTKKEDSTRLTTMANVMMVADTDDYNKMTDIIAYNKYYGWYVGEAEDFGPWIDNFHKINPDLSLCISEYGAEGIIEYHSENPVLKDYTEGYHALYHEKVWNIFKQKDFLWATYVWNMFDFGADNRNEGGVKGRNNKGLVTYDRKVKKDAYYMYKAHWSKQPFVHITGKRFVDRHLDKISVKIYSNCNRISLFVNGQEVGKAKGEDRIFVFENVQLKEGSNTIKAVASQRAIQCTDIAVFNKVGEPNQSYILDEANRGGVVGNWFEMPEIEVVEMPELNITDDVLSTRCTLGEIMEYPEAVEIMRKYLGDKMIKHPMAKMAKGMTLDTISQMASDMFTEEFIYVINKELIQIKKRK